MLETLPIREIKEGELRLLSEALESRKGEERSVTPNLAGHQQRATRHNQLVLDRALGVIRVLESLWVFLKEDLETGAIDVIPDLQGAGEELLAGLREAKGELADTVAFLRARNDDGYDPHAIEALAAGVARVEAFCRFVESEWPWLALREGMFDRSQIEEGKAEYRRGESVDLKDEIRALESQD